MAGASWGNRMKEKFVGEGWVQDQVTHKKPCFAAVDNGVIMAPCSYLSAAAGRQRIHMHLLSFSYCAQYALACYTSGMLPIQRPASLSQERA